MEESQEIQDYTDDNCYIPKESIERKKSEKKELKGKSTMALGFNHVFLCQC